MLNASHGVLDSESCGYEQWDITPCKVKLSLRLTNAISSQYGNKVYSE
jgi:hypothetical protein